MKISMNRRQVLICSSMFAMAPWMGRAQTPVNLKFSDVTSADAPRSVALVDIFAPELGQEFNFEPYFGGNLFSQGSELVAVQRGNLDMALLPPSDFAVQVPAFDILGAAYVVRDAEHLARIFSSKVGDTFRQLAREELGVVILAPAYYGARHVNLRGRKRIETPQDLSGVRLRMPGGDSWQFLGTAIGANPMPVAYAETYTALQTGVIDGQDNPLPNNRLMSFHEVTDQIVLTRHNIGFGLLVMRAELFDTLTTEQQERVQAAAEKAFEWSTAEYLRQEDELVEFFKQAGLDVYEPDVGAFQSYAQEQYLNSPLSQAWPEGMLDAINEL
ncbi:TRAP transporter substrate-binding protein DctP [Paracoccus tibetensis]|uniref:TRAP-type C4-dicarboxylate transport system, substrate-binding protein n=1 Tax=Paracoccus tibetensis TaxID=336292 RepID=A0A1G5K8R2_9RHOB|nr:TRAP transporter substrate-binding protein DctP [Paracoccus tibetensis]SCY97026.1 TRAP-type C4-dicarboxylate transport system, substrate-binding protein [Paracoccus tibetensis]